MTSKVAARIANKLSCSLRDASRIEQAVSEALAEEINAGNGARLPKFGYFKRSYRNPRTGRNPSNGEAISIDGRYVYQIKPSGDTLLTTSA